MSPNDPIKDSVGIDVPVARLRPLRERKVTRREYDRIIASIKAVGLIEPLVIYPRAMVTLLSTATVLSELVELGMQVVPCILGKSAKPSPATGWSIAFRRCKSIG